MKKLVSILGLALLCQMMVFASNEENNNKTVESTKIKKTVVKGKLYEMVGNEKVALPFANVFIEGTTDITITDADGGFELTTEEAICKVKCTYMGYESFEKQINLTENANLSLDIVLKQNK